ncbi:hypothetical protein NOVO_05160 [Rickettsiales bacterium Ac37b]|nr:hypothetical protein NOVO_05160 [Rickettsiales bacterium Ac37b]
MTEDIKTKKLSQTNLNNLEANSNSKRTDVANSGIESVFTTILDTIGLGSKDSTGSKNTNDDEISTRADLVDATKTPAPTKATDNLDRKEPIALNKEPLNIKKNNHKTADSLVDEDREDDEIFTRADLADASKTPATNNIKSKMDSDTPFTSQEEDDDKIYQKIDTADYSKTPSPSRAPDDLYTHQFLATNNKNTLNAKEKIQKIEERLIDEDDEISYKHTTDNSKTPPSTKAPDDLYTSQPPSINDKESLNTAKGNEAQKINSVGKVNPLLVDELIGEDNIDSNIPKSDHNYSQTQDNATFVVSLFGYDLTLNKENYYDPQEVKDHIYTSIGLSISIPTAVMMIPYAPTVLGALSVMVPLVSVAWELHQNHPHDQIYSNFIDSYSIPMHSNTICIDLI